MWTIVTRQSPRRIAAAVFYFVSLLIVGRTLFWSGANVNWHFLKPWVHPLQTGLVANSTLGFQQIIAISSEDASNPASWRQKGLIAAANRTGISLEIMTTSNLDEKEIAAITEHAGSKGQAQAWAAHNHVLRRIVKNKITMALIMEDDVDWDVNIKKLLAPSEQISQAIRNLTESNLLLDHSSWPYGSAFDVLWLGHCGSRPHTSQSNITFLDDAVLPIDQLAVWDRDPFVAAPEGHRAVRMSSDVLCSFAYAITWQSAKKLLARLDGRGHAFDVEMDNACRDSLKCVTIQPELIHQHRMVGGKDSLIAATNGWDEGQPIAGRPITFNIRHSARCNAGHMASDLVQCLPTISDRVTYNG